MKLKTFILCFFINPAVAFHYSPRKFFIKLKINNKCYFLPFA